MKKTPKKLTLHRETIQQLQSEDLVVVNGGLTDGDTTCAIGTCCRRSSCFC